MSAVNITHVTLEKCILLSEITLRFYEDVTSDTFWVKIVVGKTLTGGQYSLLRGVIKLA